MLIFAPILVLLIGGGVLPGPIMAAPLLQAEEVEPVGNIQRAARTFLYRQAGGEEGAAVEVKIDPVDPRLRLKRCEHDLQAELGPGARRTGNTSVKIQCQGPVRWSLFVTAEVKRFGEVVVAKQPINRGSLVMPAQIALERRETGALLNGWFADPTAAIGMQARRSLQPGDVLTDAHLKAPLWIERGQLVRLISQGGAISVSMNGEALDDGGQGDRVRVRNGSSERVVEGIVASPGVVRIPL
jgi:flagella basal body P-ring formation protein FlgA